jgi:hypothetical protein
MAVIHPLCHTASIEVDVPAKEAFDFMADGLNQSKWALGSLKRQHLGDNLFVGTSFWDGSTLYIKIKSYDDLFLVDYYCGKTGDNLQHINSARIVPRGENKCMVALTKWHVIGMDESTYLRTAESFEIEVWFIKFNLEIKFPPLFP